MTPLGTAALIATIITAGAFAFGAQVGILVAVFVKPIVDTAWFPIFSTITPGQIFGVAAPALILGSLVFSARPISKSPMFTIWVVYILYALVPATINAAETDILGLIEVFFRTLNGFVGFFMFQHYFTEPKAFRRLLVVIILAGLFPIATSIYQAVSGFVLRPDDTLGLQRYSGYYHDIATTRQYVFQTFTGVLLYWSYFAPGAYRTIRGTLLLLLAGAGSIVLYNTYSKAAWAIVAAWIVIWAIGRRQILPVAVMVGSVLVAVTLFSSSVWQDLDLLYSRELIVIEGKQDPYGLDANRRTFSGRWFAWEELVHEYSERSFAGKLFGGGSGAGAHNDFLGTLLEGGLVGLGIYLALLLSAGVRLWRLFWRDGSPLTVVACMLFAMWLIDSIGLTPRQYSGYQWLVWGFIGLAMRAGAVGSLRGYGLGGGLTEFGRELRR